jgi:hypothetical protein
MRRGPEAASKQLTEAAFGAEGTAVCGELVKRLRDKDKAVVERAARTLKKISQIDRAALYAWRKKLLTEAFEARDVRVQWNLSIVLGRLPLKGADKALAIELMFERLRDRSGLNRTIAMQALMDLSEQDAALRARVMPVVRESLENGTSAMRARARKLLNRSKKSSKSRALSQAESAHDLRSRHL